MTRLSDKLLRKYYSSAAHPYQIYEQHVGKLLKSSDTLLDAGCGRTMPVLRHFIGRAQRLIGIELVQLVDVPAGIETYHADLAHLPLADSSVNLIMSRSVFEHLSDPESAYREFARILRPGGALVFLTPNLWDYGTIMARLIPNCFHGRIVKALEGREEEDTFPTVYKTNSHRQVLKLASKTGFTVESFRYLSQYPNYFVFNAFLFFVAMCYEKMVSRSEKLGFLRSWILVTLRKPSSPI